MYGDCNLILSFPHNILFQKFLTFRALVQNKKQFEQDKGMVCWNLEAEAMGSSVLG
jgi:hypothetical protein